MQLRQQDKSLPNVKLVLHMVFVDESASTDVQKLIQTRRLALRSSLIKATTKLHWIAPVALAIQ